MAVISLTSASYVTPTSVSASWSSLVAARGPVVRMSSATASRCLFVGALIVYSGSTILPLQVIGWSTPTIATGSLMMAAIACRIAGPTLQSSANFTQSVTWICIFPSTRPPNESGEGGAVLSPTSAETSYKCSLSFSGMVVGLDILWFAVETPITHADNTAKGSMHLDMTRFNTAMPSFVVHTTSVTLGSTLWVGDTATPISVSATPGGINA